MSEIQRKYEGGIRFFPFHAKEMLGKPMVYLEKQRKYKENLGFMSKSQRKYK